MSEEIPYGYCHCGCGQKTRLATKNNPSYGHFKGEPVRFIHNHHGRVNPTERFWNNVAKSDNPDDCWLWIGRKGRKGYGVFRATSHGLHFSIASRYSYYIHYGEIPDDLWVLHRCDNPACVNPHHLFLGTHQDNMDDMKQKGRGKSGWIHASHAGEKNSRHKLTDQQVIYIRQRYSEGGIFHRELAAEFGVSPSLITDVINRRIWKHIK